MSVSIKTFLIYITCKYSLSHIHILNHPKRLSYAWVALGEKSYVLPMLKCSGELSFWECLYCSCLEEGIWVLATSFEICMWVFSICFQFQPNLFKRYDLGKKPSFFHGLHRCTFFLVRSLMHPPALDMFWPAAEHGLACSLQTWDGTCCAVCTWAESRKD